MADNVNERLKVKNHKSIDTHPLTTATYFHNRFLEIHPFADGNGRIARILVNNILLKEGYTPIFIKENNRNYYLSLFQKSDSNNLEHMRKYFGNQLKDSLSEKKQMMESTLNIAKPNKLEKGRGL